MSESLLLADGNDWQLCTGKCETMPRPRRYLCRENAGLSPYPRLANCM